MMLRGVGFVGLAGIPVAQTPEDERVAAAAVRFYNETIGLPRCHNRPPFAGRWMQDGYKHGKRRLVWVRFRMSQNCMAWAAPDGSEPLPQREKWNCAGCRWLERAGQA